MDLKFLLFLEISEFWDTLTRARHFMTMKLIFPPFVGLHMEYMTV